MPSHLKGVPRKSEAERLLLHIFESRTMWCRMWCWGGEWEEHSSVDFSSYKTGWGVGHIWPHPLKIAEHTDTTGRANIEHDGSSNEFLCHQQEAEVLSDLQVVT